VSRGVLIAIVALGVLAVAAVALLLATFVLPGSGPRAEVGDCVAQAAPTTEDVKTVDCADPLAAYKVVAVVDGTRVQAQASDETHPCAQFKEATTSLWSGEPGETGPQPTDPGKIYCLAPAK
jgi:hypothetical protein